ncbi:MAG TPA: DNA mismatch repair endonuclease MutL [Methanothrix sp.]|nr:DNA mismatch repair endonuclease MutL [Methanothrix sp.]HPR65851.1 DNA mismatch repair endonuclease MutL [Methanothrix sp.]
MTKIKLLDRDAVNKIAAGEVIERPASVVKELIENSIDAGATKILVEVAEGGKGLIRVTDDGCGMDREDAVLAFEKHATSKISGAGDLDRISTLGFRGEALSSIASVAKSVDLVTKVRSGGVGVTGTHIKIEDGKITDVGEVGSPAGTSIEVVDLFRNVPARRKYLRSGRAELARIVDVVTSYAVINHHISFELFSGNKTLFKSVRSESWNDPILRILGSDVARNLIPIEAESKFVSITGAVGRQTVTRSSPDWIMTYVNGRYVKSKALARAVNEAYRTLVPSGRYPIAVLSLRIDPSMVDVNVHPAKLEVRFLREEELAGMVTESISLALSKSEEKESGPRQMKALLPTELGASEAEEEVGGAFGEGELASKEEAPGGAAVGPEVAGASAVVEVQRTLPFTSGGGRLDLDVVSLPGGLRVLGQALLLYIVAEGPDGIVLVDQHAAAERVRYETLAKKYAAGTISQELIVPVTLELSPKEVVMLEEWGEVLEDMGFEIHPFGGRAYHVRSVPAIGQRLESPEAVHDVLRDLFALGKVGTEATGKDEILKLLACRGSIKAGHELAWKEMHDLLRDLFSCENPKTCPHGRPTTVTISQVQLEKIFGRR